MKATAVACANQGLIKYWGKVDEGNRVPTNGSISVCLEALTTTTTVDADRRYDRDTVELDGRSVDDRRVVGHLDRLRALAGSELKARVASRNAFAAGVGFASSASGFAALTVAAAHAFGLAPSAEELSRLARQGSGSASRSIPGGFAELLADGDQGSVAVRRAGPTDLDFVTAVVAVGRTPKKVSSSEGMRITTATSPFFGARLAYLGGALARMRSALRDRDTDQVGRLAELDTLNMHATMLTSDPPLVYWSAGTMAVIQTVLALREEGLRAHFSIDAGENVFVNARVADGPRLAEAIRTRVPGSAVVLSRPGGPAELRDEPLF